MKHTHKPISQSAVPGDECLMQLREHGRVVVARVPEPEMRDFIVRACNAHEKLAAALERLMQCPAFNPDKYHPLEMEDAAAADQALQALALARGESEGE